MSRPQPHEPVALFVGFISGDMELITKASSLLARKFGALAMESELLDFNFTSYYDQELGVNLKRKFIAFDRLIGLEKAFRLKIVTNALEKKFFANGKRRINIDPGYLSLSKVVLFTGKDFYHRIYIGRGIHAELTLYYKEREFRPLDWTYPDYRTAAYHVFFQRLRDRYALQLKGLR